MWLQYICYFGRSHFKWLVKRNIFANSFEYLLQFHQRMWITNPLSPRLFRYLSKNNMFIFFICIERSRHNNLIFNNILVIFNKNLFSWYFFLRKYNFIELAFDCWSQNILLKAFWFYYQLFEIFHIWKYSILVFFEKLK